MPAHLLLSLRAAGNFLLELHDELLVAGQEVPARPGEGEAVGGQGHAVVQVPLGGDVLEWEALDVAVGVTVWEDIHALVPHLFDQVLQPTKLTMAVWLLGWSVHWEELMNTPATVSGCLEFHWDLDDPLDWRFVPAGELDEGDESRLDGELGLHRRRAQRDHRAVGGVRPQLPRLKNTMSKQEPKTVHRCPIW